MTNYTARQGKNTFRKVIMNKNYILKIIIWGSMWGITECTVGYFLHMLPINIGYLFWYPIAFFFMNGVFKSTNKPQSILFIACMAATIKLFNLFMPVRIDRVINPAISIILEGIVIFIVVFILEHNKNKNYILLKTILCSVCWRGLYLVYLLFVPEWMYIISPLYKIDALLRFLLLESFLNAAVIYVVIKLTMLIKRKLALKNITNNSSLETELNIKSNIKGEVALLNNNMLLTIYAVALLFINIAMTLYF